MGDEFTTNAFNANMKLIEGQEEKYNAEIRSKCLDIARGYSKNIEELISNARALADFICGK